VKHFLILSRFNGVTIDGFWIGNQIYAHLQIVTANNYNSLTELQTPNITVTRAHIKSSEFAMSSPVIAW
jgi:hypothetical protein